MKKIFTFFLALVASVGTMFAESGTCGEHLTWALSEDGTLTISGTGAMYDYRRWDDNLNKTVVAPWDSIKESIKYVVINNGVTTIGQDAFAGCVNLTKITLPESLTEIGETAFAECENLYSITIPKNVKTIGLQAFLTISPTNGKGKLSAINVDPENPYFASINGILYDKEIKTLIKYPTGKKNYVYSMPNTVDSVCMYACLEVEFSELTLSNSLKVIGLASFMGCTNVSKLVVPNSVEKIYPDAFMCCYAIKELTIGSGVKYIGHEAFSLDTAKCNSITCLAEKVPAYVCTDCGSADHTIEGEGTDVIWVLRKLSDEEDYYDEISPANLKVCVPATSVSAYQNDDMWGRYNIRPIAAQSTETTEVKTMTTENSVNIVWPSVSGAETYELVIRDKNGNVICTLTFNAQGQLLSIAFNAPARGEAPQKTQTAGFSFTITGLDAGTSYDLTITAKNEAGQELDKKNVSFHTDSTEGIEDIHIDSDKPVKVLMDGQIYILRADHIFDSQGKMIK